MSEDLLMMQKYKLFYEYANTVVNLFISFVIFVVLLCCVKNVIGVKKSIRLFVCLEKSVYLCII